MRHVQVLTGEDRWQIQTDEDIFWVEIWAIKAIAKVIKHVESLGDDVDLEHVGEYTLVWRKNKTKSHKNPEDE